MARLPVPRPWAAAAVALALLLLGVAEAAANWEPGGTQQPAGGDDPWRLLPPRPGMSPTLTPPPPARPPDREERTETPRIGFAQHGAGTSARPPPRPPEERARTAQAFDRWAFTIAEGVVEEGGAITYVTIYGNFTFSASNPAAPATVRSFGALAGDSALEARVQYWLLIGGEPGVLESSRILEKTRSAFAYEAVLALGGDRLLMRVHWDFRRGAKTTVTVERLAGQAGFRVALASTIPEGDLDPGVALLRDPPPGLAPLDLGGLRRVAVRAGLTQYVVDWSDEPDGADPHAGTLNGLPGIVVLFRANDGHVDPATRAQVFGPSTVNPGFTTTGLKTLLSISTSLPSGGRNVIIAALGRSSADVGAAQGTLLIMKGSSVLYQTLIPEVLNSGGQRAKPALVVAVDTNPPQNAAYTFAMSISAAGTASTSVHVQGVVIKAADAVWGYNTSLVSVASGAYATVTSISTSFPAGSRVAIVAVAYGRHTASGNYFVGIGDIDLMRDTTTLASNEFSIGSGGSTSPGWAALLRLDTPGSNTQTYSVRVYNGSTVTFGFAAEIVAFTVYAGAYLDTAFASLTNGSVGTVGSLSTSLSGEVVAIGLAAADNTGASAVTAFNAGDVVLQLNNSATGQIGNLAAWYLEASSSHGRSGVLPLFRVDAGVSNPSYQIKMTARASGINGEAKILAFVISHSVTIRYSVAPGGNPVSGIITMRYTRDGNTLRLSLSTTYQTVTVDPGSTINADFVSSGSTGSERWAYSGGGNFTATVTANSVFDLLYYNQLRVTLVPVTASPHTARTSGTNYATVTARTFGASLQYSVWENATNPAIWVDRGGNVAWSQTTSGSTATHRWATPGSVTLENVQSPGTSTATYYEQWLVTWQISLAPGSAPLGGGNYAWARGTQFAGDLSLSPLVTSVTDWVDHYSLIWVQTPTSGSNATRRWINYGPTAYNVSSSGTYYFAVQEEVLARVVVADADGASVVAGAEELRFRQPNGTVFTLPLDAGVGVTGRMWLQAGADHVVVRLVWRGYAVENGTAEWSRFRASFRPASADQNSTVTLRFPRIWAGLGGSGAEIWLRSGSAVTSVVWDSGRGVLYVQSEKAQGEAYFYYGFMGRTPKYIYIDGTLFSDVGYQVDAARQVIRFTVGGGSLLFDFEGKTQPPPTTDIQSLVQQLYAAMSQLVIQQPSAPPVAVPSIDLSILARIYAELAALWDRHIPLHSSVAFPGLFLLSAFLLILAALRRAGRGLERRGAAHPREVVVVREPAYRAGFARWAVASLVSTAVLAPLLYYVLPRAFPRFFEQPAVDFRLFLFALLAAMGVALVFTALILYGLGRPARGVLREGRGR